jgi:hypothetical protein
MIEVKAEMDRARGLHPDPALLVTAFSEEAGEVVKAVLDHLEKKGPLLDVRKELIQTAAMVGRLLEEGDPAHSLPPLDPPRWTSICDAITIEIDELLDSDYFRIRQRALDAARRVDARRAGARESST